MAGPLSSTGTIAGGLTVNAGGVTSPGVGSATGVMTSDLVYSGSSTANFNCDQAPAPRRCKDAFDKACSPAAQMAVTGTSGQAGPF